MAESDQDNALATEPIDPSASVEETLSAQTALSDGPDGAGRAQAASAGAAPAVAGGPPPWSQLWQMPVLLMGMALLALGVWVMLPSAEDPDFAGALETVEDYIQANNLEAAAAKLDAVSMNLSQALPPQQAKFHLLNGDLIHLQQHKEGIDLPENHAKVVKLYQRAEDLGYEFDGLHTARWAEALVGMGNEADALKMIDDLADEPAERRYSLVRGIIERRQDQGAGLADLSPLLARFLDEVRGETNTAKRRAQEVWGVATQARGLMDSAEPRQAIDYLQVRMIQLINEGGDADLSPLTVLLAKAHQRAGDLDEASRYYHLAQQRLSQPDDLNADVLVGLAQLDLAQTGDVREALEKFTAAETGYPGTPAYLSALIGRADCEARLGSFDEALPHLDQAVRAVKDNARAAAEHGGSLRNILRSHYDLNYEREEFDRAMQFLNLLAPLYEPKLPADMIGLFALTHEKIGQKRMAQAASIIAPGKDAPGVADPAAADAAPTARGLLYQEAAIQFGDAARFYLDHARAVTLTDDLQHGDSLWKAASNYDAAQQWDNAIEVYTEFIRTRPTDPRQLEAMNRLGLAYLADGQFAAAADWFTKLINNHPRTKEAYVSYVPLAKCHVAEKQLESAERVLLHVVTQHEAITPDSEPYEEALIELGRLYYDQERFEPAIEKLTEAVERYGETAAGPTLRFRLADAYRRSVDQVDAQLKEPMAQSKRIALQAERARRLEQAQIGYSQVISQIEARRQDRSAPEPSALETLYYRNAYFYRGDCAYDLSRYEEAIALYDLAAKKFESEPASLVALVQIVNAYCELGRPQEARVANKRARSQLKRIPDSAFDDPTLPMSRQHWQDWLRWSSELNLFGPQASADETGALP